MRPCPELEAVSGSAGFSTASSQFLIAKTAVLMHPDNMLETFSEVCGERSWIDVAGASSERGVGQRSECGSGRC